ncbi:DgyrCDS7628 [Dimorphilus gyrociliatus]|uniref:DgyrCDS7628 n=1 Tax=Dimorphilus gyrociliatus TaxID=2664684 RepID=A0A7I8VTB3_9ANNE|nr:DgyrCDS7628 [Dimorphilus gyrociliatus]
MSNSFYYDNEYEFPQVKSTKGWMKKEDSDSTLTVLAVLSILIFLGVLLVFIFCGKKKGWFCRTEKKTDIVSGPSSDASLNTSTGKQSIQSDLQPKKSIDEDADQKTKKNTLLNKTVSETGKKASMDQAWSQSLMNMTNALQNQMSFQNVPQQSFPVDAYGPQHIMQLQLLLNQQKALQNKKLSIIDDRERRKDSVSRSSNPADDEDRSKGGRVYKGTRKGGKLKIAEEPEVAHFEKDEDNHQEIGI